MSEHDSEAKRRAALDAMMAWAAAQGVNDQTVASRMAHQCLDLYEADVNAYKLTGEEPVRGYRAGDLSGAS